MTTTLKRILPLFAFFIMFAGARAADYLWESKLLWESKESYSTNTYGLRFINDDKEVLYSADQAIYIRDAETGEILRQTEKTTLDYSSFRLTKDKKVLYSSAATPDNPSGFRGLVSFDYSTLKPIDSIYIKWKVGTFDYNGTSLDLYSLQEIIPISDTKVYLFFQTLREPNPNEVNYGYCLISFNPQKKDFSWDNKEDWKMEYYFRSNSLSFSDAPIITQDNKYLIAETPSGVKILDLETLKEHLNIPNSNLIGTNPYPKYIFVKSSDNKGKIINISSKKEVYNFDYKVLEEDSFYKDAITNLLIDSSKIFFDKAGAPFYDLNTNKIIYAYNKERINFPSRYNEDMTMYLSRGVNNRPGVFKIESATSDIENTTNSSAIFVLFLNGNKLAIPTKERNAKEIMIYNTEGELMKLFNSFDSDKENIYLNVSFLNQGVYFVSVISENGNRTNYKFLKGE